MPYREKKILAGNQYEVEIYPITIQERKQARGKKEKNSLPKQKNLNDKNARKHFIRLLNANFTNSDIVVHLTYSDKHLPESEEEAKGDVKKYLRRINYHRKKSGLPLAKYVAVIEFKEHSKEAKEVRMHHHVVMSGMDRDLAEKLWGKGWANADRLQADEVGYEALARYMSKDPKGNRRWIQSKNLIIPVPSINDFKFSKRKVIEMSKVPEDRELFERLYPGYIFTSCKVEINKINASVSLYIKMRKIRN